MPVINVVLALYMILYFVLASQAVFYKLCFSSVFQRIPAQQFINIRKLADPLLETRLPVFYYSCLAFGILFIILSFLQGTIFTQVLAALSFVFLIIDVILARKYNIPINLQIRTVVNPAEVLAVRLQNEWLKWIDTRGNFILAGFLMLIIYTCL
ncbi:MAG: hypothetical protein EOO04_12405 [Chitinophagaceae bacterium]|nr:MAG: hypothetical protein EOO04_12405 [Chitinophagaceae bacterium]